MSRDTTFAAYGSAVQMLHWMACKEDPMAQPYEPPAYGWRTFVTMWATQSVSVLGSSLTFFAMSIWLTMTRYAAPEQKPELAAALAAVNIAFTAVLLLVAPLAGAWADRHDRRLTMVAADIFNGLVSLALGVLVLLNALDTWLLVGLLALSALGAAFHLSSFEASYTMLVSRPRLPRANGMMQTTQALAGVLAPGIAAAIIALPALVRQAGGSGVLGALLGPLPDGTALVAIVDAATFFLAAAVLLFLQIPSPQRGEAGTGRPRRSLGADIKEGALYLWRRRPLVWLLSTFALANFVYAFLGVLIPLVVTFDLAADWEARGFTLATALALLTTVGSIGGVAGGLLMSLWGGLRRRRIYATVAAILLSGGAMAALGLAPWLYGAAAALFLLYMLIPIASTHSMSIWQTQVPPELQGRVFAVRRVIAQGLNPMAGAVAGLVGGLFAPGLVLASLGIFLALFFAAQFFVPYLRQVEDQELLDGMAARAEQKAALGGTRGR
jgi:DHA3 family macrolide efflux protein-like MFS transporter